MILASAFIYYSWFWLHGFHRNVLEIPCGTFGFLFTKISLYDDISFYKLLAILSVFGGGTNGCLAVILLVLTFLFIIRVPIVVKFVESFFSRFSGRNFSEMAEDGNSITIS
jgi:hypothetical protein